MGGVAGIGLDVDVSRSGYRRVWDTCETLLRIHVSDLESFRTTNPKVGVSPSTLFLGQGGCQSAAHCSGRAAFASKTAVRTTGRFQGLPLGRAKYCTRRNGPCCLPSKPVCSVVNGTPCLLGCGQGHPITAAVHGNQPLPSHRHSSRWLNGRTAQIGTGRSRDRKPI